MATVSTRRGAVTVLREVPFSVYETLRDAPANDKLRMTYFNGTLEIMSPEYRHEIGCWRLGIIVLAVTTELDIPCIGAGSTTFRRGGPRKSSAVSHCWQPCFRPWPQRGI